MHIDYGRLLIFIFLIIYYGIKSVKYKKKSYIITCLIGIYGITAAIFIMPDARTMMVGKFLDNIFVQIINAVLLFSIVMCFIKMKKAEKLEKQ